MRRRRKRDIEGKKPNRRKKVTHSIRSKSGKVRDPICPVCGEKAQRIHTKDGVKHECCGLRSWGFKELVTPQTLYARRVAHDAFDGIWKNYNITRNSAYKLLAAALGIDEKDAHMGTMDEETALKVPEAVEKIKKIITK